MGDRLNLIGARCGSLTVFDEAPTRVRPRGQRARYWACRCDCGVEKDFCTGQLRSGHTRSCGCGISKAVIKRNTTHGLSHCASEYITWKSMRRRCLNPSAKDAKYYAGRGISICAEWNSFERFLADMGRRPSPKHSIDRIDVNGNYEPGNCRWATAVEQRRNRRDAVRQ